MYSEKRTRTHKSQLCRRRVEGQALFGQSAVRSWPGCSSRAALAARLFDAIDANAMRDGVHIRLMVTRGKKRSPYQDPRLTIGGATIVIIPECSGSRPKPDCRNTASTTKNPGIPL